jgi:transmembrane sensor
MALPKERIYYLLEAYISKQATIAEESELMDWVLESGEDSELENYVLGIWNQYKTTVDFSHVNWDKIYSRVMQTPIVSMEPKVRKMRWSRLTAAVVIMVSLAVGTYLALTPRSQQAIATIQPKQNSLATPSYNKAILTLGDGTKIELDSTGKGTLAVQGSVQIIKKSTGEIIYAGTAVGKPSYNTLSVPIGSKPISLLLSDGSNVWINVGSSLTYPTAFTSKERKVQITGEAYFEVAKNTIMPFKVEVGKMEVKVLGTHFNITAYDDEPTIKTTLLEGSVRVTNENEDALLKPGQEAILDHQKQNFKIVEANIKEVIAWKNGLFEFNNAGIESIMRQISRWYGIEVDYQGGVVDKSFSGVMSRNTNLSQVLNMLQLTKEVHFKMKGAKVIVSP